jgi:hypothetical protein
MRQTLELPYFRLHSLKKPYTCVICRVSWLPRRKVMREG